MCIPCYNGKNNIENQAAFVYMYQITQDLLKQFIDQGLS